MRQRKAVTDRADIEVYDGQVYLGRVKFGRAGIFALGRDSLVLGDFPTEAEAVAAVRRDGTKPLEATDRTYYGSNHRKQS